jgi:TonB family protein
MMQRKAALGSCLFFAILLAIVCGLTILLPQRSGAQAADSTRKVVERTGAPYPPLARSMALQGIVKIDVLVAPDGTVKETQIKGGHPVLAQAAVNSVRRWKWEAAQRESHEIVEIKFAPE